MKSAAAAAAAADVASGAAIARLPYYTDQLSPLARPLEIAPEKIPFWKSFFLYPLDPSVRPCPRPE